MTKQQDKRKDKGRRDSVDKRSEEMIKYFINEEDEQRSGKDRRQPDSNTK
jgi:hypothetical protein